MCDDETITNDVILWRRVPETYINYDKNTQSIRVNSQAFQNSSKEYHEKIMKPLGYDHEPGMSSDIATETSEEEMLRNYANHGIVAFTAELCRTLSQGIIKAPLPDDQAHAEVMGKKTKSVRRSFAKQCIFVKSPE